MKYRKWSPSGRADGQNIEAFDSLPLMTSCGSPPEADTFEIPEMEPLDVDPAKIIVPRLFHAPPAPPGASHRIWTAPLLGSTLFSLDAWKKPTWRLSGDQNGHVAPSVPVSCCAVAAARDRIH